MYPYNQFREMQLRLAQAYPQDLTKMVRNNANENLYPNATIGEEHTFRDNVGFHLGAFTLYEVR
jgi:hypothetical protein